jgi:metallo-beta-lactamase class B
MGSLHPWEGYMEPFRLWGNIYFVGTKPASTHIIDTGAGLIMLDSGYQHSLYLVLENMRKVGLDPMDIKYIVHTHGHIDHCGATQALVKMTGAKTFLGEPDRDYVNGVLPLSWAKELDLVLEEFEADVLVNDGDIITLGNTTLTAIATPGHTPGAMSYLFEAEQDGRKLTACIHGGAGLNTLKKPFLDRYSLPYSCREDYLKSTEHLEKLKVDIYLGNHVGQNKTPQKYQQLMAGNKDAFVDPEGLGNFVRQCRKDLLDLIEKENQQ